MQWWKKRTKKKSKVKNPKQNSLLKNDIGKTLRKNVKEKNPKKLRNLEDGAAAPLKST